VFVISAFIPVASVRISWRMEQPTVTCGQDVERVTEPCNNRAKVGFIRVNQPNRDLDTGGDSHMGSLGTVVSTSIRGGLDRAGSDILAG
jgi:hypothetical protein